MQGLFAAGDLVDGVIELSLLDGVADQLPAILVVVDKQNRHGLGREFVHVSQVDTSFLTSK